MIIASLDFQIPDYKMLSVLRNTHFCFSSVFPNLRMREVFTWQWDQTPVTFSQPCLGRTLPTTDLVVLIPLPGRATCCLTVWWLFHNFIDVIHFLFLYLICFQLGLFSKYKSFIVISVCSLWPVVKCSGVPKLTGARNRLN